MVRTQVYLPKSMYQDITLLAKKKGQPAAKIIRDILDKGLEKEHKKRNAGAALLELSKMAIKYKFKGSKTLSRDIDKILYE